MRRLVFLRASSARLVFSPSSLASPLSLEKALLRSLISERSSFIFSVLGSNSTAFVKSLSFFLVSRSFLILCSCSTNKSFSGAKARSRTLSLNFERFLFGSALSSSSLKIAPCTLPNVSLSFPKSTSLPPMLARNPLLSALKL